MNINETTGETIKRSIYDDIRRNFRNRALNWNGVWKVWAGKGPDWSGRWVGGFKGMKIQMYDTIPVDYRDTKRKEYSGLSGEINQTISEESPIIHTTGNENNIRRSMKSLNDQLVKNFSAQEYSATKTIEKRNIKSYKVLYNEYDSGNNLINSNEYWTSSYQTVKPTDNISLYADPNLTSFAANYTVVSYSNNPYRKNVIEWTGDRYYVTENLSVVNQPNLIGNETSENLSARGVKKYSELKNNPNDVYNGNQLLDNPDKTAETVYEYMPHSIEANQKNVYTFDVNRNWNLNNENLVKKADYQQLQQLLDKIERCLKLRDGWFDSNDRCIYTCQVSCQNRCQVSCQACNTKQCHDQKCGTH